MNIFSHQNISNLEEKGEDAKRQILAGTNFVGEILKTTLGPKGMLKVMKSVSSNDIHVTNDGAFIMKNLQIDSPSAKILINASVGQDWEEGDGTTSVAVLCSLLVDEAYKLKIHPTKIIKGFRMAQTVCENVLSKISVKPSKDDLYNLVKTTICSKVLKQDIDNFTKICVEAIEKLGDNIDLNLIQIIKCKGNLENSYLDDGFILKKDIQVKETKKPKIMIANTSLDYDKIKVFGAKVDVNNVKDLAEMEKSEKMKMKEKVDKICAKNPDVFINRQLIYDFPMQLLKNNNVQPIEHADFDGIERLSYVLNGKVISNFDDIKNEYFGTCDEIKNIFINDERVVKFSGVKSGSSTIVLFGSSDEMLEEAERSIHDALCVLSRLKEEPKIIYGGGSSEMNMAVELQKYALSVSGVESEAIIAFSNALQQIPVILADNGGFDSASLKSELRNAHNSGNYTSGIDIEKGKIGCMKEKKIIDSYRSKKRVVKAASEVAQMLVKCDGLVKCKPRERTRL